MLPLVDVYVISIQVGFTIASGDQSRLFLLEVFVIISISNFLKRCIDQKRIFSHLMICNSGRGQGKCKTVGSGESEGQVATLHHHHDRHLHVYHDQPDHH